MHGKTRRLPSLVAIVTSTPCFGPEASQAPKGRRDARIKQGLAEAEMSSAAPLVICC